MVISSGVYKWQRNICTGTGSEPPVPEPLLMCVETGVHLIKVRPFAMYGYDRCVRHTEGEAPGGKWVDDDTSFLKYRGKGLEPTANYDMI